MKAWPSQSHKLPNLQNWKVRIHTQIFKQEEQNKQRNTKDLTGILQQNLINL